MSKKVLYISYDGMTDPLGQSQVIPYLKGLTKYGYQFTILSFEKPARYKERKEHISALLNELNIKWVAMPFSSKVPLLSKMYDQYLMTKTAKRLFRQEQFSFIHCRSYVAAETGSRLHKKFKVPFLFDMRGFWVDERVDNGQWILQKPLYKWLYSRYKKKEKQYFALSRHIISLTHAGKTELVNNYGVNADKITVIPCCVDLDHFDYKKITETEKATARTSLGISAGDVIITYLGSLGGWYLTNEMLSFFFMFHQQTPGSKFLFITQDTRDSVVNKAIQLGIDEKNIIVKAAGRKEVPLLLSLSDWSIFLIKDAYSKKASSPTKQGEIMAMGIPIICNDIGDTGKVINETGAGFLINEFSDKAYERTVERIVSTSKPAPELIREGALKFYNLNDGVQKYEQAYAGLDKGDD